MNFKVMLLATAAFLAPAATGFAQTAPAQTAPTPPTQTAPASADGATAQRPSARPEGKGDAANTVQEVVVAGERNGFRSGIDRRSYSVANDLSATTGSIGDALRNVPSVEVDVQGNISLRGDANVTILIDGKPSGMFSGENRGDALQQMPADQIDRVEVMTNPSAAFSPEGTAGVINLVTKKSRKAGRSGSVRANVGTDGRYNGGVSGSYRNGKTTVSGDLGVRHDAFDGTLTDERSGAAGDSRTDSKVSGEGNARNFRAGVDFDPDDATRISAEVRHRAMKFENRAAENYDGAIDYDRVANMAFENKNTGANASWRRKFSGDEHELVADVSFERNEGERDQSAVRDFADATPTEYEAITGRTVGDTARLKVDYTRPLPDDAKLKTGVEIERSENDYDRWGARGTDPAALVELAGLTNRFLYNQTVQAAYGTYERPLGPVTAQVGLRLEQVDIDYDQVTSGITGENDYFKAYPSVHLGYELTEAQQLTASYSRRVQRPRPEELNPYVVYMDPYTLRAGNPDLKPQETDSFEAGWQYRKGQTFYLATAYYRQTQNAVTDVVRDLGGGVFLTTRENLAENRSGGLELVANGRLTKSLTYNVSSNLFWNEIEGSGVAAGETRSGWSVGGRGSLNWQVTPKDFVQVNGFMMGERLQAQGHQEPSGMLNLGYRHKFDDKLSLVFTAQDVLDTMRQVTVIDTPALQDRMERKMGVRGLFVGLTYTFGDGQKRQREGFDFDSGAAPVG